VLDLETQNDAIRELKLLAALQRDPVGDLRVVDKGAVDLAAVDKEELIAFPKELGMEPRNALICELDVAIQAAAEGRGGVSDRKDLPRLIGQTAHDGQRGSNRQPVSPLDIRSRRNTAGSMHLRF
jgi:hypothetical protein